jgi:hypothetical protein
MTAQDTQFGTGGNHAVASADDDVAGADFAQFITAHFDLIQTCESYRFNLVAHEESFDFSRQVNFASRRIPPRSDISHFSVKPLSYRAQKKNKWTKRVFVDAQIRD